MLLCKQSNYWVSSLKLDKIELRVWLLISSLNLLIANTPLYYPSILLNLSINCWIFSIDISSFGSKASKSPISYFSSSALAYFWISSISVFSLSSAPLPSSSKMFFCSLKTVSIVGMACSCFSLTHTSRTSLRTSPMFYKGITSSMKLACT